MILVLCFSIFFQGGCTVEEGELDKGGKRREFSV